MRRVNMMIYRSVLIVFSKTFCQIYFSIFNLLVLKITKVLFKFETLISILALSRFVDQKTNEKDEEILITQSLLLKNIVFL